MKSKNQISVAIAFSIAMTAALAGKIDAESEQVAVNNNVYGLSRMGNCILADPSDLEPGCAISMVGSVCNVFVTYGGLEQHVQAFKSPISVPFCSLTLRHPQ